MPHFGELLHNVLSHSSYLCVLRMEGWKTVCKHHSSRDFSADWKSVLILLHVQLKRHLTEKQGLFIVHIIYIFQLCSLTQIHLAGEFLRVNQLEFCPPSDTATYLMLCKVQLRETIQQWRKNCMSLKPVTFFIAATLIRNLKNLYQMK